MFTYKNVLYNKRQSVINYLSMRQKCLKIIKNFLNELVQVSVDFLEHFLLCLTHNLVINFLLYIHLRWLLCYSFISEFFFRLSCIFFRRWYWSKKFHLVFVLYLTSFVTFCFILFFMHYLFILLILITTCTHC